MAHSNTPRRQATKRYQQFRAVIPRSPHKLHPHPSNARVHDRRQIEKIAGSIQSFGFINPILIDAADRIIAGHGRVEAAKLLGLSEVPTLRIDHLSEEQKRAYIIADNKLAELADWDQEILATELKLLTEIEIDFDIGVIGFETAEIDLLIGGEEEADQDDPADQLPETSEDAPMVTRPGDLWLLDDHRILCGDALDPASYQALMEGEKARMVFTDVPYNVPINGHVCGLGRIRHREFAMASGEMTEQQFTDFLTTALTRLGEVAMDGALLYVCMDWRHLYELLSSGREADMRLINICVWNKGNGGMGSFYRSKHELVCVFKVGEAGHLNNVELGRYGRYRTNVWDYAGVNSFRRGRLDELAMHPTVKPTALVADAILDCTRRGDLVLDAFVGSGTTIIAAEQTGRRARGIEIDARYVDVAVRRWEARTGRAAIHAETGMTFTEMAAARQDERADKDVPKPVAASKPPIRHRSRAKMVSVAMDAPSATPPVRHRSRPADPRVESGRDSRKRVDHA